MIFSLLEGIRMEYNVGKAGQLKITVDNIILY